MHSAGELLSCLREETGIARGMLEELNRQHRALQELDLAGLEASVVALEKAAGTLRAAEERRVAAARTLAGAAGLPAGAPLREVLAAGPAEIPARSALEAVRAELQGLLDEMHHRNYANYILMVNAARYNRALLQFVSGTSTTYSRKGAAGEAGQSGSVVLNKKV